MSRRLQLLLVLTLLVGSAVAFAVTESLKLDRSPVAGALVDKVFSPVCRCAQERARIGFRLRRADWLTLTIVDANGRVVRKLVGEGHFSRGSHHFFWNGRGDDGRVVPEGRYRPKVRLSNAGRTLTLPNPIRVDLTPPHITLLSLEPRVFSPDGDGRNERVRARYRVDERATVFLTVNGKVRVRRRGHRTLGHVDWRGRVDGRRVPQGAYRLALLGLDLAGNLGPPTPQKTVVVRYIALGRDTIHVVPRAVFRVRVLTDAPTYAWRFAGRAGRARGAKLRLRAPIQAGTYTLTVRVNGFSDQARVVVGRRSR